MTHSTARWILHCGTGFRPKKEVDLVTTHHIVVYSTLHYVFNTALHCKTHTNLCPLHTNKKRRL